LLTLIVALSVYVASIRLVVLGRLIGEPPLPAEQKASYKRFLKTLVPADVSIVIASSLLFLKIFWDDLFGGQSPSWFPNVVVWSLFVAVVVLVFHHLRASIRSLRA
jgi:hypothetical protein